MRLLNFLLVKRDGFYAQWEGEEIKKIPLAEFVALCRSWGFCPVYREEA